MLVTPGKCWSKKEGRVEGLASRSANCLLGRKRVHVKDPSWKSSAWLRGAGRGANSHHLGWR